MPFLQLVKGNLTKFIAGGALAFGLGLGIFTTRFFYEDDMDKLHVLEAEKAIYMENQEETKANVSNLTDILKITIDTLGEQRNIKLESLGETLDASDLGECSLSDELLDSLNAVGR